MYGYVKSDLIPLAGLSIKQSLKASFLHQIKHGVYPNFGPLFTPLVYMMYQRGINYD